MYETPYFRFIQLFLKPITIHTVSSLAYSTLRHSIHSAFWERPRTNLQSLNDTPHLHTPTELPWLNTSSSAHQSETASLSGHVFKGWFFASVFIVVYWCNCRHPPPSPASSRGPQFSASSGSSLLLVPIWLRLLGKASPPASSGRICFFRRRPCLTSRERSSCSAGRSRLQIKIHTNT